MTAVKRLSLQEMIDATGLDTLGYAKPDDNVILIRKGLPKEKEKEVLAHEFDHIKKGEEGPFWGAIASAAGSLLGGRQQSQAQTEAARVGAKAADPFGAYRTPFQEMLLNLYGYSSRPGDTPEGVDYAKLPFTMGLGQGEEGFAAFNDPLGLLGISPGYGAKGAEPARQFTKLEGGPDFSMFRNLPGYQFMLQEGVRQARRGAQGAGLGRSGKLLGELLTRSTGLAELTYDKEIARLLTLAGADKGSPATAGSILSSGIAGAGESRTAGLIGASQALGGAFGNTNNNSSSPANGGTTEYGDTYVNTDYGPVITDFNYE
jgi:hypothetical protein